MTVLVVCRFVARCHPGTYCVERMLLYLDRRQELEDVALLQLGGWRQVKPPQARQPG